MPTIVGRSADIILTSIRSAAGPSSAVQRGQYRADPAPSQRVLAARPGIPTRASRLSSRRTPRPYASSYFLYKRRPHACRSTSDRQVQRSSGPQRSRAGIRDLLFLAGSRAFRLHPPSQVTLLDPVPPDTDAWSHGDREQWRRSRVFVRPFERGTKFGVWRQTAFQTYFVEATRRNTRPSATVFAGTERDLIVITANLGSQQLSRSSARPRINLQI